MNYYLIIYHNIICFAQTEAKYSGTVIIKFKYPLRHIEANFDTNDSRILNIKTKDRNNNFVEVCVNCDEIGKVSIIKQAIEENKKSARSMEYLLLDSYFDESFNNLKF